MTYEILEHRREADPSGDEHERLTLSLNTFAVREKHHFTGELFRYWDSKRRGFGALPLAEDFKPHTVFDSTGLSYFGLIDVSTSDPANFSMTKHTTVPPPAYGTRLAGVRLAEFPSGLHARALVQEYNKCTSAARPAYHEIKHTIGEIQRHYSRVMLPLVDSSGSVVMIAYGCRRFLVPDYQVVRPLPNSLLQ